MIREVYPTSHFRNSFKKIPNHVKKSAVEKEKEFIANPFSTKLRTHKLKGKLKDYWAFSVGYEYRILFRFIDDETVLYFDIGTHEIYR